MLGRLYRSYRCSTYRQRVPAVACTQDAPVLAEKFYIVAAKLPHVRIPAIYMDWPELLRPCTAKRFLPSMNPTSQELIRHQGSARHARPF